MLMSELESDEPNAPESTVITGEVKPSAAQVQPSRLACAQKHPRYRIAVLSPWITNSNAFPPWFYPYFLSTLGRSSFLVDWLVVHEGVREPPSIPENAKLIDVGRRGMSQLVASTIGAHLGWDERNISRATKYLRFVMYKWPRIIAEYKPAFGIIFARYLSNYTHWAFSDLDTQFGALPSFIELAELRDFDMVSYSFGDHDGLYLRGQWTMHRNAAEVNRVWTTCSHLGTELIRELTHKVKWIKLHEQRAGPNGTHRQNYRKRFISAEGCYSTAAFDPARGMRIKIAHKQFVGLSTKSRNDVIVVNGAVWLCRKGAIEVRSLLANSQLDCDADLKGVFDVVGPTIPITPLRSKACSNWIAPEFRVCANSSIARSGMNVYVDSGNFSAAAAVPQPRILLSNGCQQAALFHFQEWKKGWGGLSLSPSTTLDMRIFKINSDGVYRIS